MTYILPSPQTGSMEYTEDGSKALLFQNTLLCFTGSRTCFPAWLTSTIGARRKYAPNNRTEPACSHALVLFKNSLPLVLQEQQAHTHWVIPPWLHWNNNKGIRKLRYYISSSVLNREIITGFAPIESVYAFSLLLPAWEVLSLHFYPTSSPDLSNFAPQQVFLLLVTTNGQSWCMVCIGLMASTSQSVAPMWLKARRQEPTRATYKTPFQVNAISGPESARSLSQWPNCLPSQPELQWQRQCTQQNVMC